MLFYLMHTLDEYLLIYIFMQPEVDFGLKLVGGDMMAIPGLYQFIQVIFVPLSLYGFG